MEGVNEKEDCYEKCHKMDHVFLPMLEIIFFKTMHYKIVKHDGKGDDQARKNSFKKECYPIVVMIGIEQ
jgi:hypothetical protein